MNNDLFAHAWARCDRAGEIARQIVEIWNGYIADHPYTPVLIGQGEGVFILRVYEDAPMPETFAVAVGEWINHLRSALDYTIWAAAAHASGEVPPPGEGQLQYPIYDSLAAWKANLSRLAALGDHHRAMLLTMQPFNSDTDANYLGWINRIARSDRHRHLSRMAGYIAELEPAVMAPAGCTATLQWGERAIYDGYADVARVVVSPWSDGMEVEINPRMGIDPDVEAWCRSPFWRRIPFPDRLRMLQVFVGAEIAVYEYDATGASRKQEALTAEFRVECDTRLAEGRPAPQWTRPAVEWSGPVAPRRSTTGQLEGDDFPPDGPGPRQPSPVD